MTAKVDTSCLLAAAMEMARSAGKVHLKYFRSPELRIDSKLTQADVVTQADKEAEKIILERISSMFPEHGVLSEESGNARSGPDVRWIVDPLDGTTNFSQGLPLFSVSIAVEVNGEDAVGVVYAPVLDEMFHAVKGQGAYLNGKRIHCSQKSRLDQAVVATGFPVDKDINPDNNIENVARVAPKVRGLRRLGSAAIDISYVAAGFLDGYWEMNLHEWDVAAARLIAAESGAKYSLWRSDRGISALAAAPHLHGLLAQLLK